MTRTQSQAALTMIGTPGHNGTLDVERFAKHKALVRALLERGHLSQRVKDEAQGAIIIAKGDEVGMHPMEALRQIYVIGGIAAIQSDGMRALLLRTGRVRIFDEECTPDKAVVRMVRYNDDKDIIADYTATWTTERAQEAGFKSPLYRNDGHRQTMLRHKATGEAARAVGPDIIGGMYTPEEFGVALLDDLTPEAIKSVLQNVTTIGAEGVAALHERGRQVVEEGLTDKDAVRKQLAAAKFRHGVDKLDGLTEEQAQELHDWFDGLGGGGEAAPEEDDDGVLDGEFEAAVPAPAATAAKPEPTDLFGDDPFPVES
jgi:hypothetical protein